MQQTEKYKLNLIEKTDTFSPDPLNQNTQKVEDALKTKADTDKTGQQFAALAARVTTLEGKKIAIGTYTGNNYSQQAIRLPFAPMFLFLQMRGSTNVYIFTQDIAPLDSSGTGTGLCKLEGATLYVANGGSLSLNAPDHSYVYLAIPQ